MKDLQDDYQQHGAKGAENVKPAAKGNPDTRRCPYRRSGGNPAHVKTESEDCAGTEKADAAYHLRHDTARIRGGLVQEDIGNVYGHHHYQAGADRKDHMGPEPGRLKMPLTLETYQETGHKREDQTHRDSYR